MKRFGRTVFKYRHKEIGFEAVHLASEEIAFGKDVHYPHKRLWTVGLLGQKDQPGTGSPYRMGSGKLPQRIYQPIGNRQLADGGAFATRNNEPSQPVQLFGQAHFSGFCSKPAQDLNVFAERALEGQNTDL